MSEGEGAAEARFRRLFEAQFRPILAFALRRTATPADAADVASETMLVAWRRIAEVPVGEAERLWLFGVARNVMANTSRSAARRHRLVARIGTSLERDEDLLVDDDLAASAETIDLVRTALDGLDDLDREVLELSAWDDLGPSEIAVVLGIPQATARTRLHRARARLRAALEPDIERFDGSGQVGDGDRVPRVSGEVT